MKQIDWFNRKFEFVPDQNILPTLLERLMGTPVRLEEKLKGINPDFYTLQIENKWSVLEHIGHLSDLEPLWQGRLEDILHGRKELRTADLENKKTSLANHNTRTTEELLQDFKVLRDTTIRRLQALTEEQVFLSALHPRLKSPMRTLDLFLFVADHDDHHLAKMTEINQVLVNR